MFVAEESGKLTFEVGRIRHRLVASSRASSARIGWPTEVPTNSRVDDQLVLEEMLLHVANRGGEERSWATPGGGIGLPRLDVGRDAVAEESPHFDTRRIPEMGIDTARADVEVVAIRLFLCITESAASVVRSAAAAFRMNENGADRFFFRSRGLFLGK